MNSCRPRRCIAPTDARLPAPSGPRPAPTGSQPAVTRSQGARHAAPPPAPLSLRFRALLGLGFVPPLEPRPCAHCASIAYALLPAARVPLCRHRADPESSSRSLPSGSSARIAPIAPTARRRPRPPPLSRCVGPGALAGKNRTVCIPFSPNARKRPSSWQHPPEMHAFRDQDGNILALCIHFRAQSGDSGYMARESCRQGPSFASRNPKSRMTRRCCQRRAAFPRQRPAVRPNGLCAMRQRHATRGMAERALRPAARAWPACCMRPPCHLACARRGLRSLPSRLCPPPSYTRCASPPASRPRTPPSAKPPIAVGVSRLSGSSCCPRAAHADASCPPMRARRHRPSPNPSQPSLAHPWSHLRPHPAAGSAAGPVIPVKWCGDTSAHTRKLRF